MDFYTYKVKPIDPAKVHDGDSFRCDIDLGFKNFNLDRACRIAGIDTPEMAGKTKRERDLAVKARDNLRKIFSSAADVAIVSVGIEGEGQEKYGRCLCKPFALLGEQWHDVAQLLIDGGFARAYDGGKKGKW